MKKSIENFTIVHHFKKDKQTFLKESAKILGEFLAEEVMNGNLILTTDKQA